MKHIERPGLYIMVFFCLFNTCSGGDQRIEMQRDLDETKNRLEYAIELLEGGEPSTVTELDCSHSTEEIIDCRPQGE